MSEFVEQRSAIKFCLQNEISVATRQSNQRISARNCRLTIRDLADTIGISRGSLNTVSKDIL